MGDWALSACELQEFATATVSRTAGANTKSSYVQLIATTGFAYSALSVLLNPAGGGGQCYLVDIAIGAGGSEVVIVPNILLDSMRGGMQNAINITLPISVPAGTRLAARLQEVGGAGTRTVEVCVIGRAGGSNIAPGAGSVANYGSNTANSNGVLVDQGATANTFGAWTEITSGTSANHSFLTAVMGTNQASSGVTGSNVYNFQMGAGASGSEVVLSEFQTAMNSNNNRMQINSLFIGAAIPAGTRLSMRAKCNLVAAIDRIATATILGC